MFSTASQGTFHIITARYYYEAPRPTVPAGILRSFCRLSRPGGPPSVVGLDCAPMNNDNRER